MDFRNILQALPLFFAMFFVACQPVVERPDFEDEVISEYAGALYNNQLYKQSIQQYTFYLDNYDLDKTRSANVIYLIGNIYFERMHDYENALAYYLKLKHLYAESEVINEANKKMVMCLERLQRSADAQQVLEEAALLDPDQAKHNRPGEVIAKIGKRTITTGDLEHEIAQLPPYLKVQLDAREKKIDFLKQHIATELFYSTAKRGGLDKDPGVIEGAFRSKKNLMVQKLLEGEIAANVNVQESDIETYYQAHREEYTEVDEEGNITKYKSLEDARLQVMQDVIKMKQSELYNHKVQNMMRAESVVIFEDKL